MNDEINLFLKNLLFTLVVPGMVAVYVPVLLVWDHSITSGVGVNRWLPRLRLKSASEP